jgi:DNA-nicking Smr family endonuclease
VVVGKRRTGRDDQRPSSPPAPNASDEPERFEDLISDVERRSESEPAIRPQPSRPRSARDSEDARVAFDIERAEERLSGLPCGGDRRALRRLERGEVRPERRIDLHGLTAGAARRAVRAALAAALASGQRCLLVIHGRGLHSDGDATLRESLPTWLTEAPHARDVLAFASALPRDGGAGACYVLLRRRR